MKFTPTELPGVVIVEPTVFGDDRGWFYESFNEPKFHAGLRELGLPTPRPFVQDNHSRSATGVLRGLHYQLPPHPQGKLVRVVRGRVWDVAVDIRKGSPTFGRWVGLELSQANHRQLWIPEGFAHGFLSLEDDTEFLYKTTGVYAKDCERAIRWDDPQLRIAWPAEGLPPALAPKDAAAPLLAQAQHI
ncbi:MAG: dTDP-4-dehydrorhamnose 3,5-epimerase [Betaproteobacteria bacterium]|nr:dTDP-4-dehydrorhamnose 3,5-epimerase [Betaproteobacteria bacterium]